MAGSIADEVRRRIAEDPRAPALLFEAGSEFELRAIRRIVRAVAKQQGLRMLSMRVGAYGKPPGNDGYPCGVFFWNPDYEPTEADRRRAALAIDQFLGRGSR